MSAVARPPSKPSPAGGPPAAFLERIEWPVTLSVVAYGVHIGVRINDPNLAGDLACHLPPGATRVEYCDTGRIYSLIVEADDPASKPRSSVYVNDRLLAWRATVPAVLRAFESDVQLHVAEMAPEHVFVHAGAVSWRGRGILLPGRSFTGKTTLVAELVRAGAEYYSDEYAVLDSAGSVYPYARPLSIREKSGAGFTKHAVDTLGGRAGSGPLPVALVVISTFRPDGEWRPQHLSPGNGLLALLANTVPARRIPEVVMATLHRIVSVVPVVASERGEAASVVEPILELAALP
ncbi:MAG: hypothetical protein HYR72_06735 [Deltaproteobacteria bacterium]|nr:hypothetical protein [Deltaproteobacteria bacterium]MBI3387142.1 hypothetical protein [Deltaproteobacteria bacterium]